MIIFIAILVLAWLAYRAKKLGYFDKKDHADAGVVTAQGLPFPCVIEGSVDAPPMADRVKWWPWVWKIALVVAVGVFGRFASQANDAHKAKLKAIETAPVVLPELVTPKPVKAKPAKSATVKIATEAINTPATPEAGITVSVPVPVPVPETQFDRDLINFETLVRNIP